MSAMICIADEIGGVYCSGRSGNIPYGAVCTQLIQATD